MEAEQKSRNTKRFLGTQPKKNIPGRMAQTPRAGMGDSVGRFRRYYWSTLINYDSNFSMFGTFLKILLLLPDIRELVSTSKEAYDLNLSAAIWEFGHFEPQRFFVPKNSDLLPSPRCGFQVSILLFEEKSKEIYFESTIQEAECSLSGFIPTNKQKKKTNLI